MSKKIIRGVKPTRIELLKLRKRELLAQRGHDLLEEKRDAMFLAFLKLIEDYQEIRPQLEKDVSSAYETLTDARLVAGSTALKEIASSVPEIVDIEMDKESVMGVMVPVIHKPERLRQTAVRGYSYVGTSVAVDDVVDGFEVLLQRILVVAEKESAIRKLAHEIESTKRRVNALETVLLPRLRATERYIEIHLEELEREDLFRRKRMKVLLEE